ncbi:MAG TPA: penicillin-binding protein 2 [Desulfobacterales bacterium]|nr:penicillin-binding protein 2 [Desulfobacterales bacterium]
MKARKSNFTRLRILLVGVAFAAGFAVIGGKALQLQVYQGSWLSQKASDQVEDSLKAVGKRGAILDRRGREMAVSIDVTSIAIRPAQVKDVESVARDLASVFKRPLPEVRKKLTSGKPFVWIKRQATPKEVEAVRQLRLPGIEFVAEASRFYPNRTLAAQVIGFTGMDGRGLEGVEFFYDSHLRGTDTSVKVLRDALGNGFQSEPAADTDGSGKNLILTLDQTVQFITETALKEALESTRARSGMAVVMEPKTGALLALAVAPTFNPNAYDDFKKPVWRNRAITDPFEPGSTLKIFVAAAALEFTSLSPQTTFNCENGSYRIGKHTVHDVHRYGVLSLQDIIKFSSNIGAAKIGEKVGPENLHQMLRLFGFGQKTGIDGPSETTGLLMLPKKWANIDTAAISFGHGISVSAVQLITAVSAIANDGVLMKPRIVQAATDKQGQVLQQFPPEEIRRTISRRTAQTLKEILQAAMLPGGTGVQASLEGYTAAGKTGTARKIDDSGQYANDRHVASFIGFAPVENPRIAVLVVIDEPKGQIYGGAVAAPVFKKIAQSTLNYLNVPPKNVTEKLRVSQDSGGRG